MSRAAPARRALADLARSYGVQASYTDDQGRRQRAGADALLGVLRARGVPIESPADAPGALRARRAQLERQAVAPVLVAWDGRLVDTAVLLGRKAASVRLSLETEDGDARTWDVTARARRVTVRVPDHLPLGRHRLRVEAGNERHEAWIVSAPRHAWMLQEPQWGVFAPLYAMAAAGECHGTYNELHTLAREMRARGAGLIATLPLLAAFLDEPFEPSPYAPASRLFWNELYVDPTRLGARPGADVRDALAACASAQHVDYHAAAAAHRQLLQPLADRTLGDGGDAGAASYAARADVAEYARFRAVGERLRTPWRAWPARLREGRIREGDYDPAAARYHAFVQWAAEQQIAAIARDPAAASLYLDMPLGVHPDSYDTWRYHHVFATEVSAGAPPDALFRGGQDWGFPPLDPDALRADGYAYLTAALRQQLRFARVLRLDHVMSLYRLYWIPAGLPATDGAYVRYPEDELFAVLTLESMRHHAAIVGEDLGTVPAAVPRRLERHAIHRMFVVQYEASPERTPPMNSPPERSAASLNTHDMPTFAGFWQGHDISELRDLQLVDAGGEQAAREQRAALRGALAQHMQLHDSTAQPDAALDALLDWLAAQPAAVALLALEDLWLEDRPQNVPGTGPDQRPNWRRRFRHPFPDVLRRRDVSSRLERFAAAHARGVRSTREQQ